MYDFRRGWILRNPAREETGHQGRHSRVPSERARRLRPHGRATPCRRADGEADRPRYGPDPYFHHSPPGSRHRTPTRDEADATGRGYLGVMAEKILRCRDGRHGRHDPRSRSALGPRGHQGLRRRRHMVGLEAGDPKSATDVRLRPDATFERDATLEIRDARALKPFAQLEWLHASIGR